MRLLPILGMMTVAWLLMIAEAYIFFSFVLSFAPPVSELGRFSALALLKVGITLGLGGIWFLVMQALSEFYTTSRIRSRPPTPSS